MDPGTPAILIVVAIAGPFLLLLGLSWLFNPDGRWPWRRAPNASNDVDRERFRGPGWIGPSIGGGDSGGGGGDVGGGGS
jgi:hypothetical protein